MKSTFSSVKPERSPRIMEFVQFFVLVLIFTNAVTTKAEKVDSQNLRALPSIEDRTAPFRRQIHSQEEYQNGDYHPNRQFVQDEMPDERPIRRGNHKGSIDKSEELQSGTFTSLSASRPPNPSGSKKTFVEDVDDGRDQAWDVGHLLKLKFGGLVIAALVGVVLLFFVLPGLFGGVGFAPASYNGIAMPGLMEQLLPGLYNNQYNQYNDPYKNGGEYGGYSSSSYNSQYNHGRNEDKNGRSLGRGNGTNSAASTIYRTARQYFGQIEICAAHVMCIRGKDDRLNSTKVASPKEDDKKVEDDSLSDFEEILKTMNEMKGIRRNMPLFNQLYKAYKGGKVDGADCTEMYKQCPVSTAKHLNKAMQSMGKYLFN